MDKRQKIILIFSIVVIIAVVAVGLFVGPKMDDDFESPSATSTEEGTGILEESDIPEFTEEVDETVEETEPEETVEVITNPEKNESLGGYTITASESGYSPNVLTVTQGNIVKLTLRSEGGKYDLSIPAMNIRISAPEGGEKQTSFRVPQSGTFRFECESFCPRGGAVGQIIVKPRE
jgi:heme/copper-type cytochrome/quinol oxidase subunit 2